MNRCHFKVVMFGDEGTVGNMILVHSAAPQLIVPQTLSVILRQKGNGTSAWPVIGQI